MRTVALAALLCAALAAAGAGRVPDIPAGHRAQYSLQHADGSFKYGWDTGLGATAQVEGDAHNEVRGSYSGGPVSVAYTAGVNGYVPTIGAAAPAAPAAAPPPALLLPPAPAHGAHAGGVKGGWSSGWSTPQAAPAATGGGHIGPAGPLRPDGSYSFSFSTGDQSRQESADAANNVRGSFSFRAKDDGRTRTVNYHAGAGTGFVAQGQHLPTPPPVPLPQGAAHPGPAPAPAAWDSQWPEEPEPQPEPAGDAAYQFGYQTQDASRHEASDPRGNVHGSYSYVGPDGVQRRVDYEAGAGKGFVVRGDHLPKDGDVPPRGGLTTSWQTASDDGGWQQQQTTDDGGWQQQQTTDDSGWQQKADGGDWQQRADGGDWQQRADGGGLQPQHPSEPADVKASRGGDGSYSFSYSTKDQSREERGDAKGNVKGSFSFVAKDDGQRRRVDYHAGAATGFVAKGDHLPKPQPSEVQTPQTEPPATTEAPILLDDKIDLRVGDTQQTVDGSGDGDLQQSTRSWLIDGGGLVPTDQPADVQSSRGADGSYQFSYKTPDQSREEQADAKNNVKGSFSFVAPDGKNRRVDYEAGAGKGFVAKGDHLPKAEAPGTPGAAGDEQQTQQPWAVPGDDSQQQTEGPWDDVQHGQGPQGPDGDSDVHSGDAGYSYSYETDSSRKQESADAQGNVQGFFSYNDGTGSTKTVAYTARAGEGFKAKGDHLPKPGQFLAAAAAAGVGGSVHGGAWGRGRGPGGALRPGVGVKTSGTRPRGPATGVQASARWPQGLRPQGSAAAAADPHGPAGEVRVGDAVVRTYLPPGVPGHKVGYVYEAKS